MIPGNPARTVLGPQASPDAIAELEIEMGLNKSKVEQYVDYVVDMLHGDFGYSYVDKRPVTELIAERIPNTLACLLYTSSCLYILLNFYNFAVICQNISTPVSYTHL